MILGAHFGNNLLGYFTKILNYHHNGHGLVGLLIIV
jgi:hypothetical protein